MAGNMLMINVGVNSKDAENSLASLEETLKNISKQDAELKVGENLAAEVENARKKYLDMVKMVNSTEGELQKAFAISGLRQTIADVNALNKKIAETGAKIKPIELQSVMFDGKELFDIKGIDKSLDKFAKKLDKDSNDAFANILTTNLGQKFFSKQKNELEKQLETDLKDLAKDFSQDKLEQYINKYLKIRSIDVAKNGKDKIATSGVTPKAITDLIDNKAISKQLAEGKIDVKAMFQKKATDVGFVKNMKDQIFSELMVFLNQNTDANTFGTKYTDAQMTEMTQGAKESKKQIKLLKEEFIGLINQYNGFNRNSKIELVLDTVARIESLRKELKGLGQDISEINNIEKQDEYKENLNTLKYTLIPDGNDDYYDEDFDTYLLKLKNDFNKLNNTNIQSIMSMNIGDEKKIEKLKENLTQIDELLIKTNSYDSIVPNVSSEVIGDIEILKKQRGQIIAGLKQLNVDVAGVGIPMADYIAGGNKGSGGSGSGTVSGSGNYDSSEVDALKTKLTETQTEAEKLKTALDSANTELEKLKGLSSQSENDNNKITMLTAQVNELTQKLTSAEEKKKALESQIASSGSMNNSSGSVQLGEGEQIAKTSNIEAVKKLSDSIKNLQDRMSKAEEILKEVPQGMDGLKKLSSQIEKMSGNFNEDGSIKNMGVSAEALSEQLKNLDAEFDARITKKIEELEKKSYKENQPKKKFKLAESVKSLKVVAEKAAPKVEAKQVDNDVKSAQQDAAVKTEETTKELYKETEEYKTLSKAVQEYNALTSQKLDATAYDARIERLQKMQALVTSIIETVEKYEGKASELSELTLKSKNGNIGIQDTVKLDELMSKLKAGEAKNISKKEQTEQLKQDAQKYVDVVRDYNNKFQSIISQKVSSGKQFNSMKQQLNDLSNSIDTIMDKYDQLKGQDFYSADFASYGEELRGTVKDSSLDLNEITKFKGYEQEILSIQLKYSESLQKQKKEQDAVAEAARKKAEAEKEAVKATEEAENKMSVAEKSREEQKRKALERQAVQNGNQTSNINSAPPDNATLSAILTEVKSINGKMDKPAKIEIANNSPETFTDGDQSNLDAYKKKSKEDQIANLWVNYGEDSIQLTKAKINSFSGTLNELIQAINYKLEDFKETISNEIQNPSGGYDDERADGVLDSVQQLSGLLEMLKNSGINNAQKASFDSTAIDNILAEVKAISQKMDTSTTKASNNASPNISANQSPNNTPSSVTTPSISSEVQAASEAATAEAKAFNTIDEAVKNLTGDINTKTEAIRAEATEMTNAAKSEVASVSLIKQAVSDLATQIHNVPKVRIVGENDGKLNISANLTEEQIAVIREKLKAAFSGEQAIPISFVPNVEGLKQQIADALKNVPVEITNNNINKVIKVNKFKANSDGVEALRNSISSQLKNVKIQSFDATTAAESVKETLSKVLDGVGLKFDTEKLGNEVREAVNSGVEAASAEQKPETSDNKAVRFKEKATNDIGKLRDKYTDKLQGQQLEVFKERLNEIDNKIKEIKDDASNYTDENAQVIDKDIKQIESLVNSFKEINNSEDKINSLIQKLKDSKNNIERRGAVAQPVVNNINSEMSALEELKRSGQNLNVGNPAEVQAFIDKLNEADATVESLQQSAKDIRVSTNTTASVAKLDSKFNDLLFKVDKFKRDNSKITSDKGISAQFDSLLRSIQTIEKSDVNFQRLRAQFDQLKATVQGKGLTGRSLGDELKYIAEKIGIKAMLGNSIYRVIGAFRQMVGIVTELDTGMTTLRRVTEETEATYRKFLKTAGDEAHELGSTVSGLVDSTGAFARLGYNIQESSELAKNALMYSNVGWLDIETATADMTSTMKAFNIEASDSIRIVDTFDILGKKLPLVTISVKGWRHSRPSKDIVNHNICVTTAGGVW